MTQQILRRFAPQDDPLDGFAVSGSLCDLLLSELVERLAVDAQSRGRPHLQPLEADFDAAVLAVPVVVLVDARDRFFDLLDELALAIAVTQLEAMSDSWLARSFGSAKMVASSCIAWTVRSISCDSSALSASRTFLKCACCLGFMYSSPFFGA